MLGHTQVRLGHEPPQGVQYNVFRGIKTGKRVCILTNSGIQDRSQEIQAFGGKGAGRVRVHVPFQASRDVALPATITVPAERIVFVEELLPRDEKTRRGPSRRPRPVCPRSRRPLKAPGGGRSIHCPNSTNRSRSSLRTNDIGSR